MHNRRVGHLQIQPSRLDLKNAYLNTQSPEQNELACTYRAIRPEQMGLGFETILADNGKKHVIAKASEPENKVRSKLARPGHSSTSQRVASLENTR